MLLPLLILLFQQCKCPPEPLEDLVNRADLVIVATVESAEGVVSKPGETKAVLQVVNVLKGKPEGYTIPIFTPSLPENCGVSFTEGGKWLILARRVRQGEWYTEICDGTRLIEELDEATQAYFGEMLMQEDEMGRFVMPGFEFAETLNTKENRSVALLYHPDETLREAQSPFWEATVLVGPFHRNGVPLEATVFYRCHPIARETLAKDLHNLTGIPLESMRTELIKDDYEALEYKVWHGGDQSLQPRIVRYEEREKMTFVYFTSLRRR